MIRGVLLGTGGPWPDPQRHGPGTLLWVDDVPLLFDAGRGVVLQMVRAGVSLPAVTRVFLTHHHYDHISDLADVMITSWITHRDRPMHVYGPAGTERIVTLLLEEVYDRDLEFRTRGEADFFGEWQPVIAHDVGPGPVLEEEGISIVADEVEHGHGLGIPGFNERWACLGYRVEAEGTAVTISGDTVPCAGLDRLARGADTLVMCCFHAEADITSEHRRVNARHILASSGQVGKVATRAGVRQLVLTHIMRKSDEMMWSLEEDVRRDFSGRLLVGHDLLSFTTSEEAV